MRRLRITAGVAMAALLLASCGGGGSPSTPVAGPTPSPTPTPTSVYARPAAEALSPAEVETIIARAAAEASARGSPAVIAVVDRVGNVLAVYRMAGARATALIPPNANGANIDAQGVTVPAELAAIAKAITGAYLSSGGNAFSTRTASMIVQPHFPPSARTVGLESGPLYGVQFSQLPCSDLNTRFGVGSPFIGPKRSPLGLAADPGGFPLYKNGVVVGGVGIMADGDYGFDPEVVDVDNDDEEHIALAATAGHAAPDAIRAERISVDGTLLRYSDAVPANLKSNPASPPAFASLTGSLVAVAGFNAASIIAGTPYGSEGSGVRGAAAAEFNHPDAFVLSDGAGANRYPIRAGTDAGDVTQPLSAAEVRAVLEEAFTIMARSRAQIRLPLDSRSQKTIAVVDTRGAVLGLVRSPDAPIFGTDVALQKARSVAFFSGPRAGSDLAAATTALGAPDPNVRDFVARVTGFFTQPGVLSGAFAISNRAIGNISRPYFPDGEVGRPPGPLSRDIAGWSPFSTGLQSALIIQNLGDVLGGGDPRQCTFLPNTPGGQNRLANGLQIFPGGVPIYRGTVLVGAIGVSGDGIDQDDMTAFLGTANAATRLGGSIGLPPASIRSDQIVVNVSGTPVRLRFVNCPFAPFLDTAENNVCQGR
ncbi:heme-binding protein [Sandarakinorhabdus oryzae]|uniref:heme-binding protein n=1 Tax=Sandarakinorhabdus oryzae TaxID=2675220 RepID=UPI0012E0E13F|nr:heme-binding protein [Sandarakinorhabdus oryzae]